MASVDSISSPSVLLLYLPSSCSVVKLHMNQIKQLTQITDDPIQKKIILTPVSFHPESPNQLYQPAGGAAQEENSQSWELCKPALTPKKHLHKWNIYTTELKPPRRVVITHLQEERFNTCFLSILVIQTVDEKRNWVRKPVYLIHCC